MSVTLASLSCLEPLVHLPTWQFGTLWAVILSNLRCRQRCINSRRGPRDLPQNASASLRHSRMRSSKSGALKMLVNLFLYTMVGSTEIWDMGWVKNLETWVHQRPPCSLTPAKSTARSPGATYSHELPSSCLCGSTMIHRVFREKRGRQPATHGIWRLWPTCAGLS